MFLNALTSGNYLEFPTLPISGMQFERKNEKITQFRTRCLFITSNGEYIRKVMSSPHMLNDDLISGASCTY